MSKNNKNDVVIDATPVSTVDVDTGLNEASEEKLLWEGLVELRASISQEILKQQAFVLEIAKANNDTLSKDAVLFQTVEGLMKSIGDLAHSVVEVEAAHKDETGSFKTGEINGIDEQLEYLGIGNRYITINENLANLISAAYLEIFVKLNVGGTTLAELNQAIAEGKAAVADTVKGE